VRQELGFFVSIVLSTIMNIVGTLGTKLHATQVLLLRVYVARYLHGQPYILPPTVRHATGMRESPTSRRYILMNLPKVVIDRKRNGR